MPRRNTPSRAGKNAPKKRTDTKRQPSRDTTSRDSGRQDKRTSRKTSSSKPPSSFSSRRTTRKKVDDTRPTSGKTSRSAPRKKEAAYQEETAAPEKVRLNKFIANSGVSSRREADQLIQMGLISVNGKVITELGYKVMPGDKICYENKVLNAEKPVYMLLNKPKGYLTTTKDPQERQTVMALIHGAVKERVYPVGRLDRNTTGLLLLTNDGDLAEKLSHPSYNVKKIYKVELDRPLNRQDLQRIMDGVMLEEGRALVDDIAIVSPDGKTVGLELHIGWNRVVRRIFEALEYRVIKLDRTVYAGLDKKDLPRGHWRFLRKDEVIRLKHFKK